MSGKARGSPRFRRVADLEARIEKLHQFEKWGTITPLDFESLVESEKLQKYWGKLQEIHELMREAQALADGINADVREAVRYEAKSPPEQSPG